MGPSRIFQACCGAALAALVDGACNATLLLEILPAHPRYQEPVVARVSRLPLEFGVFYGATASMRDNSITVTVYSYPELGSARRDVSLGQLPAGDYSVEVRKAGGNDIEASGRFTVAPAQTPTPAFAGGAQVPSVDFSGQWWNPLQPGSGIAITQGPTALVFAEWFVHDAVGAPIWYTLAPGGWIIAESTMIYGGTIYRTTAPYWAAAAADPPANVVVESGTLSFTDAYHGTLSFVVDGVRAIEPITRLPIE